jgi:hypothetical protein
MIKKLRRRLQNWILYGDAPVPLPKFGTRRRALVNRFLKWVEHDFGSVKPRSPRLT